MTCLILELCDNPSVTEQFCTTHQRDPQISLRWQLWQPWKHIRGSKDPRSWKKERSRHIPGSDEFALTGKIFYGFGMIDVIEEEKKKRRRSSSQTSTQFLGCLDPDRLCSSNLTFEQVYNTSAGN
jgi:hypothetical protein